MITTFPRLASGAISQYPTVLSGGQGVEVLRFLDGSDQRFLLQGKALRQWLIRLDRLNESELQQIEAFFEQQQGDYTSFDFPDPFSGVSVPNCRFANSGLKSVSLGVDNAAVSLVVVENNG